MARNEAQWSMPDSNGNGSKSVFTWQALLISLLISCVGALNEWRAVSLVARVHENRTDLRALELRVTENEKTLASRADRVRLFDALAEREYEMLLKLQQVEQQLATLRTDHAALRELVHTLGKPPSFP